MENAGLWMNGERTQNVILIIWLFLFVLQIYRENQLIHSTHLAQTVAV